jgi:ADP-dependent NAD(P)H-hydrate dehydratase / NAD(P)H-hydrate epimerase
MPTSTALYPVSEIREIEQASLAALPQGMLMQRAGNAAAQFALSLLSNASANARILAIAGPGNNGGDAIEAARLLSEHGLDVTVLLFADPARLPSDARHAFERAQNSPLSMLDASTPPFDVTDEWDLVIDGLFGIGLKRPMEGLHRSIVEAINSLRCPVLALDVPSGLDADTGAVVGGDNLAIRATHTLTFIADKPGLHTLFGRDYAGHVHVASLDIDESQFKPSHTHLSSIESFKTLLKKRPHNTHKGSYGDVMIVGGAPGMAGAAILAARAAAKCGAGRVFAAFIDTPPAYDSTQPELMCRSASAMDFSSGTVVAGPGMGMSREAHDALSAILHTRSPLVLDADALNLIASEPALQGKLAERAAPAIMTPHPLEAARLLNSSTKEVQSDRLLAARELARRFQCVVVLKGSGSVIARPDGEACINTTGNPALSTAGTGDVLAGICGALFGQGFPAWQVALAATWIHGQAADTLVQQGSGPIGLTASELIPAMRTLLNQLTEAHATSHR